MISCRGGIPFGNSAFNSASRSAVGRVRRRPSVDAVRRVRALLELRPEALAVLVRAARVVEVVVVRPRDWRRPEFVVLEVPTTPCACRRWAPSAAARENVRPHSGHVNSCCVVGSVRARAIANTSMFGSGADSVCEAAEPNAGEASIRCRHQAMCIALRQRKSARGRSNNRSSEKSCLGPSDAFDGRRASRPARPHLASGDRSGRAIACASRFGARASGVWQFRRRRRCRRSWCRSRRRRCRESRPWRRRLRTGLRMLAPRSQSMFSGWCRSRL